MNQAHAMAQLPAFSIIYGLENAIGQTGNGFV